MIDAVLRPTQSQIKSLGAGLGFTLSDREAQLFERMLEGFCQGYDVVDRLPNSLPQVNYPRTPGYEPPGEENRFNAWARKLNIKGKSDGILAGKRIVLKDSICLAGVPMSVGAAYLQGYVPEVDATIVTRVLDHGGEIVGKAVCEYCVLRKQQYELAAPSPQSQQPGLFRWRIVVRFGGAGGQ